MRIQDRCRACGNIVPSGNLQELCPICLLKALLPEGERVGPLDDTEREQDWEDAESPALEGKIGTEPLSGRGVLSTIASMIGPSPRMLPVAAESDPETSVIRPSPRAWTDRGVTSTRYQILGEIARGGMGIILKGRDPDLGRDLAVKVLQDRHKGNPELVRRFIEEAQIGGQLQHPGIVPIYELGAFDDHRPYFTMRLIKGRTLADLLNDRPVPEADRPRLLGIFAQVCQTVAYAHARGVIHRDLKPSNVMVGGFGEVQVMDWGLAKILPRGGVADDSAAGETDPGITLADLTRPAETLIATARSESDDSELSQAGSIMGTPSYMAPEQARGEIAVIDKRADVFAIGSILCEILTGAPAFQGRSSAEIHRLAVHDRTTEALARLDACGADAELVTLTRDCLAVEPADRPRDAGAVRDRMTAYLAGVQERLRLSERALAAEEARAEEARRTASAERRSRRLTVILAALIMGLVVLGGGGYVWRQRVRSERWSRTASAVNTALAEAARLHSLALATPHETGHWTAALAQAQLAANLLHQGIADASLHHQVAETIDNLTRDRDLITTDRRLLADLEAIRGTFANWSNEERANSEYAAAFQRAGLDLQTTSLEAAGAWIKGRSVPIELATFLDDWASLHPIAGRDEAERQRLIATARAADPDPWRDALRSILMLGDTDAAETLRALADDARALEDQPAMSLVLLARQLKFVAGDRDRAEVVLRRAWRQYPGDFWVNFDLATVHRRPGTPRDQFPRPLDSLPYLIAAVAIRPFSSIAHVSLAYAWLAQGNRDEAELEFREAVRTNPKDSWARFSLAEFLRTQGRLAEAEAAFHEAIRVDPDHAGPYHRIGLILWSQHKWPEAEAKLREAIQHRPDSARFHSDLGRVLGFQGRYEEALTELRHSRDLDPSPSSRKSTVDWIRRAERQAALGRRLPAVLRGEDQPANTAETFDFALVAYHRQLYAASARLFTKALEAEPKLTDGHGRHHHFDAARSAVLAAAGQGQEDPLPDIDTRAALRHQALGWLQHELAHWSTALENDPAQARPQAARNLRLWQVNPDLASVRNPDALAALPEAERNAWQAFWADVERLLTLASSLP